MNPQSVSVNPASPAASSCSLQVAQQDLPLSCISSHLPNMEVFANWHLILLNCLYHIHCHLVKSLMEGNSFSLIIAVISQSWKLWREWNMICVHHQTLSTMNGTADLFNSLRSQYCFEVVASQKYDSANIFHSCLCSFFVFMNVSNVPWRCLTFISLISCLKSCTFNKVPFSFNRAHLRRNRQDKQTHLKRNCNNDDWFDNWGWRDY